MYKQIYLIVTICFSLISSSNVTATNKTLGEIKKELVGKTAILIGEQSTFKQDITINSKRTREYALGSWVFAEGNNQQGYKKRLHKPFPSSSFEEKIPVPYRYKGAEGKIIAVDILPDPNPYSIKINLKDAFGEPIDKNDLVDPYFDVIVHLQSGELVTVNSCYLATIINGHHFRFSSDRNKIKKEIIDNIDTLIGKTIYPVAESKIFPPDVSVDKLITWNKRRFARLHDVPNFIPLEIIKAKYLEKEGGILIKVKFLSNRIGIIFDQFVSIEDAKKSPHVGTSFLDRATFGFKINIPKSLTAREVEAIKKRRIFKGMSSKALEYSWGYEDKKNDWGNGGKQLIFNENQYVYLKNNKIVNWQVLE